jgi:hypothetical protein
LTQTGLNTLSPLSNYVDDVLLRAGTFEMQWRFVADHLLPRLLWSLLKVSFKKVRLGMATVKALGWTHHTGGKVNIEPARVEKLRDWPVPRDQTGVRSFLASIGPCRRWIPNRSEIATPLTYLTGKVDWEWGPSQAVAFTTLRDLAASSVEMAGYNPDEPVEMYSDASGYGGGCVLMQKMKGVDRPILYDSINFTKTQRAYGTYKRELCAIVEFCRKHCHYLKGFRSSTIWTDHKPLTWFMTPSHHEGVYARWVTELRHLNVTIRFITGKRNKVADGLSRTIFPDPEAREVDQALLHLRDVDPEGIWVWKDGTGGYEGYMKSAMTQIPLTPPPGNDIHLKPTEAAADTLQAQSVWLDTDSLGPRQLGDVLGDTHRHRLVNLGPGGSLFPPDRGRSRKDRSSALSAYLASAQSPGRVLTLASELEDWRADEWYGSVVRYLLSGQPDDPLNGHEGSRLRSEAETYKLMDNRVWKLMKGRWLLCLRKGEVAKALEDAHDRLGHLGPDVTRRHLARHCWWPGMAADVVSYVWGCLPCAEFGPNLPKALDRLVAVYSPLQLVGMDFIGLFPETKWGFKYILVIVDYFSRYMWLVACRGVGAGDVLKAVDHWLTWLPVLPMAVYMDSAASFRAA